MPSEGRRWFVPVGLSAVAGEIEMFAFTNVFSAGPEPPGPAVGAVAGSVSRVRLWPLTLNVVEALKITEPPVGLVNSIVA